MKYKRGLLSTDKLYFNLHCCIKSNASQNTITRLIGRVTEILFKHPKYRTKTKINNLRIQRFRGLIHWFHFDSVLDVLHVLTVEESLL